MNSLLYLEISNRIRKYEPYKKLFNRFKLNHYPVHIRGLRGGLCPILLGKIHERLGRPLLSVMPTEQEAALLVDDLQNLGFNAALLPWWGTVPYKEIAHNSSVFGTRLKTLEGILNGSLKIICTGLRGFLAPLPPPKYIRSKYICLKRKMSIDSQVLRTKLVERGYMGVKRVSVPGEFSIRGEVCDIFEPGDEYPLRIVSDWNEISMIRRFDSISQNSIEELDEVIIRPSREIIWDNHTLAKLRKNLEAIPELRSDIDHIMNNWVLPQKEGHERFFPLAFAGQDSSSHASISDYLGGNDIVCIGDYERCCSAEEGLIREYKTVYRKFSKNEPIPMPKYLLTPLKEREAASSHLIRIPLLSGEDRAVSSAENLNPANKTLNSTISLAREDLHFLSDEPRSFFGNINFFKKEMANLIDAGYEIFLLAGSEIQKERLSQLFHKLPINIIHENISAGFSIPPLLILVVHENELFGRKKRVPQSVYRASSEIIESFVELDEGDYVVHVNYGIGRFIVIQRITAGGYERDYIKLEYAGEEFILVPIEQVNLIQRYIGSQGATPRLDRIGGKSWAMRTSLVSKHVEDLAKQLIDLYSKRKKVRGYAFPPDSEWQLEFEATFPFEETEDQIRCIEEVKSDMEKPIPMDRLICGDVGYGKTEIALRAAFKAISSGKQVALLAPTTILAEQHYKTALGRSGNFPINIRMMSRMVTGAEQKKILSALIEGSIDLVIGTHRIIQKDVSFKNIGLIIIDEEQRFGVKAKERLKKLKTSVDCLTLSATPIPRTLHMSLLKIRDISMLKTPPYNRRPIETHVQAFSEELIAAAIRREIEREGQIFYLHNRIETLETTQLFIQRLVPEVLVEQAHGQMNPHELEDIMYRFINGGFQVLVATTIIENGIDIPNVNTIIIDRADMYGISQLYQLRGRVGRSGRLAYAYLFYPEKQSLSELAIKRLQIISDNTELGSGFKIAMKDLEIRGAGNLLGSQQSGDIYSIGFDLYLRLLDQAIRRLSSNDEELPSEVYLEMEYTGFIPESYISDTMEKMDVYKRIAAVSTQEGLGTVHIEITNRFGPLPDEVASLLSLAEMRVLCRRLGISMLRERKGLAEVHFSKIARLNIDKVTEFIRTSGGTVRPDARRPQVLLLDTSMIGLKEKSEYLRDRLSSIVDD